MENDMKTILFFICLKKMFQKASRFLRLVKPRQMSGVLYGVKLRMLEACRDSAPGLYTSKWVVCTPQEHGRLTDAFQARFL